MASAWNSDCAPFPITAIVRAPFGARCFATMAEVAAVRSAVSSVISDRSTGYPVPTSASSPNAVTVCNPSRVFFGCPFTYLNP